MAEGRHGTGCDELANPISEIGGVDYSPVYDLSYYMGLYPDLGTYLTKTTNYGSFVDDTKALRHFIDYGMAEGRRGCESFDVQSYYNEYFDLRRAYGSDLKSYYLHYLDYGMAEGRHGTGYISKKLG